MPPTLEIAARVESLRTRAADETVTADELMAEAQAGPFNSRIAYLRL